MIQVFDTHRLPYRNAVIRAYDLSTVTNGNISNATRLDFYNIDTTDDIGDTVYTNEAGYLCRSGGQQTISCLVLDTDAWITVSLDNGTSWPISWAIKHPYDPTAWHPDDPNDPLQRATLKFYEDDSGVPNSTDGRNVILGHDLTLPDYLLRDEYVNGHWEEDTVMVYTDTVDITEWTSVIIVRNATGASPQITLNGTLRAGQKIIIVNHRSTAIRIRMTAQANWNTDAILLNTNDVAVLVHDASSSLGKARFVFTSSNTIEDWLSYNHTFSNSGESTTINISSDIMHVKNGILLAFFIPDQYGSLGATLNFDVPACITSFDLDITSYCTDLVVTNNLHLQIGNLSLDISHSSTGTYRDRFRVIYNAGNATAIKYNLT